MSKDNGTGSVLGGMLLITGSCLGAGMLGIPIMTGISGFFPSMLMFFLAWLFMTTTALLVVEANSWFKRQVNLLSMTEYALGRWGRVVCWVTYLFLFYALLVAYISGIGGLTSSFFQITFSVNLPLWVGCLFFVLLFGWIVYLGTRRVDHCNRVLMFGKIAFFVLLVLVGVNYLTPSLLLRTESQYMLNSLPLLVIAFGFHNMIPSLTAYLKGDIRRVRITIIGGSLMVLVIYFIWEVVVLGTVPVGGADGLVASLKMDREASQALAAVINSPWVRTFSQGLAFFALLTSFLAQALSLVHFLSDGMKIKYTKSENVGVCAMALVPPLIVALIYPQLFFQALNFAGGICAVILFGLLPAAMVWIGRYRKSPPGVRQVPGGKATLVLVALFACFILFVQLSSMLGAPYIPNPRL